MMLPQEVEQLLNLLEYARRSGGVVDIRILPRQGVTAGMAMFVGTDDFGEMVGAYLDQWKDMEE